MLFKKNQWVFDFIYEKRDIFRSSFQRRLRPAARTKRTESRCSLLQGPPWSLQKTKYINSVLWGCFCPFCSFRLVQRKKYDQTLELLQNWHRLPGESRLRLWHWKFVEPEKGNQFSMAFEQYFRQKNKKQTCWCWIVPDYWEGRN